MGSVVRLWSRYKQFVEKVIKGNSPNGRLEITHWRDLIFSNFVTYLSPICLIALVPGVFIGVRDGYYFVAAADLFAAISIPLVALNRRLHLLHRKIYVIVVLYFLALVLLVTLGLMGPGIVYLLALSVLVALFFPARFAYWSVITNVLICIGCAEIINLRLFNSPLALEYQVGNWIAISSNLVFLSWICIALIGNTIKSLEDTLNKENKLKANLQKEMVQRIKANALLKESEGHYKSLFSQSPSPMWVLDGASSSFLQVNESAVKTYGYTNDEFMAMTIKDVKLEKDMDDFNVTFFDVHKPGTTRHIVTKHRRKNQEEFHVEVMVNLITFKGKTAKLVIVRDMTEQINFTKAIKTQNAKLRQIAFIQSHVVRAPLARIMGLISLVTHREDQKPDPEVLRYLDQSAKELDDIIMEITNNTSQVEGYKISSDSITGSQG